MDPKGWRTLVFDRFLVVNFQTQKVGEHYIGQKGSDLDLFIAHRYFLILFKHWPWPMISCGSCGTCVHGAIVFTACRCQPLAELSCTHFWTPARIEPPFTIQIGLIVKATLMICETSIFWEVILLLRVWDHRNKGIWHCWETAYGRWSLWCPDQLAQKLSVVSPHAQYSFWPIDPIYYITLYNL